MTEQTTAQNESLLTFPQLFPIKVMGLTNEAFQQTVEDIARTHFDDFDATLTEIERSRTGKYTCVTVTVNARSREQLDAMYLACTSHPLVKVVL